MAHSLSAKKRVRQNVKRRLLNRDRKRLIRVELKKTAAVITSGDPKVAAVELEKCAASILDRISVRGGIHRQTAARVGRASWPRRSMLWLPPSDLCPGLRLGLIKCDGYVE